MIDLHDFLLTFIPILVAINVPGVLPIYISISEGMNQAQKQRIITQSVFTALIITIGFVFLGRFVFRVLGIQIEDFMIAGGLLLLVLSIVEIVVGRPKQILPVGDLGSVPLGTPLLAGPATLTTALVLAGNYGYLPVVASLTINLAIAWICFHSAEKILVFLGPNGARAMAKIAFLLLAAIAVHLIKSGIFKVIGLK